MIFRGVVFQHVTLDALLRNDLPKKASSPFFGLQAALTCPNKEHLGNNEEEIKKREDEDQGGAEKDQTGSMGLDHFRTVFVNSRKHA